MGLCDRFHALPSQVMKESATILRLLKIEAEGKREEVDHGE